MSDPAKPAAPVYHPDDATEAESTSSDQIGSMQVDDVLNGMKFAELAITDDQDGTLENVGKSNPWHIEALTLITGNERNAHKPLTVILSDHLDLKCDKVFTIKKMTSGGQFIDTQGYIAHNDEVIVLSYRCTTSFFDWLANFNTTSSEWEVEEDLKLGYSGLCSGFQGLCCQSEYKPRVHTGFYNNFLVSVPDIKEYIHPLLQPDQPPRTLYVVGHSLGAGIATLASCYFLFEYDWNILPHKFVSVTAGSPRACQHSMKDLAVQKLEQYKENVAMYRLVRDRDVVTTVPPAMFGFTHVGQLVHITENDMVVMNPSTVDEYIVDSSEMMELLKYSTSKATPDDNDDNEQADDGEPKSKYEKFVAKIPRSLRDHMPDFYLKPLMHTRQILDVETQLKVAQEQAALEEEDDPVEQTDEKPRRKLFSRFRRGTTRRSMPQEV